jgi:hypothetical protein
MARSSRAQGVAVAERGGWHSHSCARHGGGGAPRMAVGQAPSASRK